MGENTGSGYETSQPVYHEAASKLRAYIERSDLKPGDFLPSERKLSEAFNISRHTLREAIKVLQEKGILASKRGSGNYIASTSPASLKQQLLDCVQTERDQLADIFQFREMLEPQIAAEAARNATADNIKELASLIELQADCETDKRHREIDDRFHLELAVATGNQILATMVINLRNAIAPSRSEHLLVAKRREISLQGHKDIFDAIKTGNPVAAAEAMNRHLQDIKENVFGSAAP